MNFRHAYLASLGFEHLRIAKSEIGALFAEEVVPVTQLRRLCLRVGVGVTWRGTAWKILLNVIPPQHAAWELAAEAREHSYGDLLMAAETVLDVGPQREDRIMAAYALYTVLLSRGINPARGYPAANAVRAFLEHDEAIRAKTVVRIMCRVFPTDWEAFWCSVRFVQNQRIVAVLKKTGRQLQSWGVAYRVRLLSELLVMKEPDLARLLREVGIREEHFAGLWFRTFFADVLREDNVMALWDHIIAAPADFVSHFSLELLKFLKPRILSLRDDHRAILRLLSHLPPLPNLNKFTDAAAAATASLLDKDHHDPLLTFDVEWPTVMLNSRGVLVKVLQLLLRARGFGGMFSVDGFYGARTAAAITNWRRRLSEERRDQWKTSFTRGGLAAAAAAAAVERDVGEDLHVQHLVDDGGGDGGRGVVIGGGEERKGDRLDGRKFPNFPPMAKISSATFELPSSVSPNESPSSTRAVSTETPPQEEIETEAVGASLWPTLIQPLSVGARGDAVRALQALLLHGHGYNNVREDGYFGTQTVNAVKDFQATGATRTMPVDGIVGPVTWIHLLDTAAH